MSISQTDFDAMKARTERGKRKVLHFVDTDERFGRDCEPRTSPLATVGRAKAEAAPLAAPVVELESDVELPIVADCRERGWLVFWGDKSSKSHRTPGEPDLTILAGAIVRKIDHPHTPESFQKWEPRVLFIECKHPKRKRSPVQLQVEAHARKLGHTIHLVKTWEQWLAIADGKQLLEPKP